MIFKSYHQCKKVIWYKSSKSNFTSFLNKNGVQIEDLEEFFRLGDRVLQTENDYDKDIFNGDLDILTV